MNYKGKAVIFFVVLFCLAGIAWRAIEHECVLGKASYSQFLQQVLEGEVATVIIVPGNSGASRATYTLKTGNMARTILPSDYRDAVAAMQDKLVNIEIQESSWGPFGVLTNAIPFLLLLGIWVFLSRRLRHGPDSYRGHIPLSY